MNRRQFLKTSAGAAALFAWRRRAYGFYQSPGLRKFVQPLRTFTSTGSTGALPIAASDGVRNWGKVSATHYSINLGEFQDQLHPALGPTTLWGYNQGPATMKHLGGTIVANRNEPVQITFRNQLPDINPIPVDTSTFFADGHYQNAVAAHLHGGFIPWISDGGPFDWFTRNAVGPSFKNNQVLVPGGSAPWYGNPPGSAEYYWPNQQSARLMWYHDHGHDLTRINAYAGLATGYVLRDSFENGLIVSGVLPGLQTGAEIPLIFQDKTFVGPNILGRDPTWPGPTAPGSLWYPHVYEGAPEEQLPSMTGPPFGGTSARWAISPGGLPLPDPSCVPEAFQDTMLVNGLVYPYLEVQPRRYRFRILNACNARFLNLQLYIKDSSPDGITLAQYNGEIDNNGNPLLAPMNPAGPAMVQIGNECGFLPAPVILNSPPQPIGYNLSGTEETPGWGNANRYTLLLGCAERADVVIDFSAFAGRTLILYSDAPAPFPTGDVRNDYYHGMPTTTPIGGAASPAPGFGPNTRTIMEFRVTPIGPSDPVPFAVWLSRVGAALASRGAELAPPRLSGATHRVLSLNEGFDPWGRLIQTIGTDSLNDTETSYGRALEDAATEVINEGAVEVWEIYNLTGDTHPIHFHLINLQIINRQLFDPNAFPNPVFLAAPTEPDPNERGWKETIRMNPAEVIRVIAKFDLPKVPFAQPSSDRATLQLANPPGGKIYHEYVYHCHILEHEEHDMMRPLIVVGKP